VEFTVGISEYPENQDWHIFPSILEYVVSNAQNKLNFALEKFPGHDIVIAADTVVEAHGAVYEKPTHSEDTKRMMRLFSGTSHHVHTAIIVASRSDTGYTAKVKTVTTLVEFDVLEETSIEAYGNTKEWEGKAGGYGIQMGGGGSMIKSITGCYYNIMGFPINAVANALREVALEHFQPT
jgi:septum formation protein